jgi:ubiquinone/menaquinone biosynthesis C-methylase UbiE
MVHREAVSLIEAGVDQLHRTQTWIDLGAGSGTFTTALATLLGPGSTVYAVDKDKASLKRIEASRKGARIAVIPTDFVRDDLPVEWADGILAANALHFVADLDALFARMKNWVKPDGRLIIIEYDTDVATSWIPFPLSFSMLQEFAFKSEFTLTRLGERPSLYNRFGMYAALLMR